MILEVLAFSLANSQEELWREVRPTGSWGLATAGSEDEITCPRGLCHREGPGLVTWTLGGGG